MISIIIIKFKSDILSSINKFVIFSQNSQLSTQNAYAPLLCHRMSNGERSTPHTTFVVIVVSWTLSATFFCSLHFKLNGSQLLFTVVFKTIEKRTYFSCCVFSQAGWTKNLHNIYIDKYFSFQETFIPRNYYNIHWKIMQNCNELR